MSLQEIKGHLGDYLSSHGINHKERFMCLHPDHKEKTPSAVLYDNNRIKCYGCDRMYDIFNVAHWIEGLPEKSSKDFFRDNALVLANRYGVYLPEFYKESGINIHNDIHKYIIDIFLPEQAKKNNRTVEEEVENWAPEVLKPIQINLYKNHNILLFVKSPSYMNIILYLTDLGYTKADINNYGVNKYIFDPESSQYLIVLWKNKTFCNGFMKRQLEGVQPKYISSSNSPILIKQQYLYGTFNRKNTDQLFIVEGQKDALAIMSQGYDAVAVGTNRISNDQYEIIKNMNYKQFIIAMDSDGSAGVEGNKHNIELFIKDGIIPFVYAWEHKDPEEDLSNNIFISTSKILDSIVWYVDHMDFESKDERDKLVKCLSNISSNLDRTQICKYFGDTLDIDSKMIIEDVNILIETTKNNKESQMIDIYSQAFNELKKHPDQHKDILDKASQKVASLVQVKQSYDNKQAISFLQESCGDTIVSKADQDFMFRDKGLLKLSKLLSEDGIGWTTTGTMFLLPGHSHTGKTLLLCQTIAETLLCNNDSMVFLYSTDDNLKLIVPRIVAAIIGDPDYHIGNYYKKDSELTPNNRGYKKAAINLLTQFARDERFIAKDVATCKSMKDMFSIIKYYKKKYPNRKPICFNDNFHRNSDYREYDDLKRIELAGDDIKRFVAEEEMAYWGTAEKRKPGFNNFDQGLEFSADNNDILGSGSLVYYATHIIHTVNDMIQRGKDINMSAWTHSYKDELLPQTHLKLTKSKTNGFTGTLVCNMFPKSNLISITDKDAAYRIAHSRAVGLGYIKGK